MRRMSVSLCRTITLAMVFALGASGCAIMDSFQDPQQRVTKRAQQHLDALMAGDMEKAFSFLSPAFRETTTWQRYSTKYAGVANWREATVERVDCEIDRCDVAVAIRYVLVRPKVENTRFIDEVWIEVGGQWYIYAR